LDSEWKEVVVEGSELVLAAEVVDQVMLPLLLAMYS
jgi:hypothetical protein